MNTSQPLIWLTVSCKQYSVGLNLPMMIGSARDLALIIVMGHGIGFSGCFGQVGTDTSGLGNGALLVDPIVPAEFPGGEAAMFCFIDSLVNRQLLEDLDDEGTSYAQFLINTTGVLTEISILNPSHPILDNELVRLIRLMPPWTPAMVDGKAIALRYNLPLRVPYTNRCID